MSHPLKRFWRQNGTGFLFISPWLIGFVLFMGWPFLRSVYLSFTSYDIVSPPRWIGTANYDSLLHDDPLFWKALWVTLRYALIVVPLTTVMSIMLALLLNVEVRGQAIFRTIFFLPSIVPSVATSVLFVWLLNPELGLVNGLLRSIGIEGPAWLTSTTWAPWSLALMSLWGVGGSMVIYLAGLKDIPLHLYEAARLDGANSRQALRHVTLPMLTPVIFFNVVMGVIGSFQYFTQAYVMTKGGPEGSTTFYALYMFQRAWQYLDMGYASAMAWILFIVVTSVTALLFTSQKKWVHFGR